MGTYIEADADLPLVRLCRRHGPPTSKAAATKTPRFAGGHRALILKALEAGPAGQTELARRTGMTVAQVSKRLHELRKHGQIERTGREVANGEDEYRRVVQ